MLYEAVIFLSQFVSQVSLRDKMKVWIFPDRFQLFFGQYNKFGSDMIAAESFFLSFFLSSVTVSMSCWATSPCWPTALLPSFLR